MILLRFLLLKGYTVWTRRNNNFLTLHISPLPRKSHTCNNTYPFHPNKSMIVKSPPSSLILILPRRPSVHNLQPTLSAALPNHSSRKRINLPAGPPHTNKILTLVPTLNIINPPNHYKHKAR